MSGPARRYPLASRLAWLVLLWAGAVLAAGLVALVLRLALRP